MLAGTALCFEQGDGSVVRAGRLAGGRAREMRARSVRRLECDFQLLEWMWTCRSPAATGRSISRTQETEIRGGRGLCGWRSLCLTSGKRRRKNGEILLLFGCYYKPLATTFGDICTQTKERTPVLRRSTPAVRRSTPAYLNNEVNK
eukprot:SAG11_NODE_2813_length_2945_cov_1.421644_1_plen_146_part_00